MSVVARATVRVAGFRELIYRGHSYADDNPVVLARPDLFETAEQQIKRTQRPTSSKDLPRHNIETARRAPGEQRTAVHGCTECGYEGTSEHGLKVHEAKAHA